MIFGNNNIPAVSASSDQLARYAVDEIFKPVAQELALMAAAEKKSMKGESIAIPAYANLAHSDSEAGEFDPYQEVRMDYSAKEVFAIDCGLTLPITRKAKEVAHEEMQLVESHKDVLKERLARDLDKRIADSLKSGLVKAVLPNTTSVSITVNGTPSGAAGADLNVYHVRKLEERARQQFNMAPKADGYLHLVSSFAAMLTLESDPAVANVLQGLGRDSLESFYKGKLGGIKLLASNHTDSIKDNIGTGTEFSEFFLLGKKSHFVAFRRAPQIVLDAGQLKPNEFGKFSYLNYNYAAAFGRYTDSVNKDLVRVIHGSST